MIHSHYKSQMCHLNAKQAFDQVFLDSCIFCPWSPCHVQQSIIQSSFIHFSATFLISPELHDVPDALFIASQYVCQQAVAEPSIHTFKYRKRYLRASDLKRTECFSFLQLWHSFWQTPAWLAFTQAHTHTYTHTHTVKSEWSLVSRVELTYRKACKVKTGFWCLDKTSVISAMCWQWARRCSHL